MAILRAIQCDVCGKAETEKEPNAGWKGWGHIGGIVFKGNENPSMCPECLSKVADFFVELAAKESGG